MGQLQRPELEPHSDLLCPFQSIVTILEQFCISLRNVCLRVSGPKVLERLRTLCRLQLCDAEAPEDIEPTLYEFQLFQDGMEAVSKDIGL